jgi:hypothetical protein
MNQMIDGAKIELECSYGHVIKATVGQLRRSPTLQCPQGHRIRVDGSQFNRDLRPLDRAMTNLDQAIRRIGH